MVICAACKQYTDDEGAFCQQCGEPLVAATFDPRSGPGRPESLVADLAADQKKAQLLASGVIGAHTTGFFFEGGQQRSVLVELFGAPLTHERKAEVLLFGATAYLAQHRYVKLEWASDRTQELALLEAEPWDGQDRSLEGNLALQARRKTTYLEALQQVVAEAVGFRLEIRQVDEDGYVLDRTEADLVTLPLLKARLHSQQDRRGLGKWLRSSSTPSTEIRARLACSPATGVIEMALQTVLPPHEQAVACRETYQMLQEFIHDDPERTKALNLAVERVIRWFVRCEQHPERVTHEL
jgi:hypothetical protein